MTQHMSRELDRLKKGALALSAVVEESVQQSIQALEEVNVARAEKVIAGDVVIDQMEVDLEEECLKVLALHQPVAIDLRFIIAVLKINNDLERIGDLAANIAERAVALAGESQYPPPFDVTAMAAKVQGMLKQSLDSLVQLDTRLAGKVLKMDDEIDALHSRNYKLIKEGIRRDIAQLENLTHYLTVSRHLERIADLATNIAEDVIYMIEGEIVRHKPA